MCSRSIQAAARHSCTPDQFVDTAFNSVIGYLVSNKTTVHSTVNLYTKYVEEGGQTLSRRQLVYNIIKEFKLRFKKSVAFNANSKMDTVGLNNSNSGLLQGVGDNFDQQICSQNGKIQTHSMALLMTQSDYEGDDSKAEELLHEFQNPIWPSRFPMSLKCVDTLGLKNPYLMGVL